MAHLQECTLRASGKRTARLTDAAAACDCILILQAQLLRNIDSVIHVVIALKTHYPKVDISNLTDAAAAAAAAAAACDCISVTSGAAAEQH
jgi:hypothetical protein